ncbi:MAG: hypothetical protein HC783_01685 [Rhodobacteraceae bacterium]|nr:hypothetical protein [Paracoccaceae bacterium]
MKKVAISDKGRGAAHRIIDLELFEKLGGQLPHQPAIGAAKGAPRDHDLTPWVGDQD